MGAARGRWRRNLPAVFSQLRDSPDWLDSSNTGKALSMGMNNTATKSETKRALTTVTAWSPKIWPAMPSIKTMGAKTATVVKVEAVIAPATSPTPRMAACTWLSPSSRQREMDSKTTMALSTNMPTPRAKPPRDMMFKDTSIRNMGAKVVATEIGIARAITRVGTTRRKKTQMTSTLKRAPSRAESRTSCTAAAMNVD